MKPEQIKKDLRGRTDPHELLPSQLITTIQRITKQRYQLAADNQRLREALRSLVEFAETEGTNGIEFFEARNAGIALLAATPVQALDAIKAPYEARIAELMEAGNRMLGDHNAPTDCYATGPLTGDPYRDLIMCPSCVWEKVAGHNPADSLEAYRRKVLEEAADAVRWECEVYSEFKNENPVLIKAVEVIRRMAGKE